MIVYFCDLCTRKLYDVTPGTEPVLPPNTVMWGGHHGFHSTYHFCSRECRDGGVNQLMEFEYIKEPIEAK